MRRLLPRAFSFPFQACKISVFTRVQTDMKVILYLHIVTHITHSHSVSVTLLQIVASRKDKHLRTRRASRYHEEC